MDLASGYSDSTNYGNGYTPLANNAISNNNANYNNNQAYANLAGMYNPFAQSGGFGAMTDYYSNAGAAYGRATGGFNGGGGYPSGDVQRGPDLPNISPTPDPFGGMSGADMATWTRAMQSAGRGDEIPSGGSSSFADRYSAAPAIDYRLQPNPSQQLPQGFYDGIFAPTTPRSVTGTPEPQQPSAATGIPNMFTSLSPGDRATWQRTMEASGRGDEARNALAQTMSGGASFNDRFGNLPGQPYGQGYFDNTFGSVAGTGGTSTAQYQGNPFYMPQPMQGQQAVPQGGGFGAPGFGIGQSNYTGQPGFGLGIGGVGAPGGGANVGNAYGTSGQNPVMGGGAPDYGFGGLPGGAGQTLDTWTNRS